jgi:hypothetical protein
VIRWRDHSAPISAPHIGAVAFSTDSTEAVSVRAPYANNRKGRAELKKPSIR